MKNPIKANHSCIALLSNPQFLKMSTYNQAPVSTVEELDALFELTCEANEIFRKMDQESVDRIFKAASLAASEARIVLAREAVEETGIGLLEDKVIKNHFAAENIYNKFKDMKTAGVVVEDKVAGFRQIAEPLGTLAGIIPTTNPTSTTIFKCLLALKTRNTIIFSPHPRAKNCTMHAAQIVRDAAIAAGAPANCIGYITTPSIQLSQVLMSHDKTATIIATGGPAMVKAAYSSGNPAIGVGPGNVPCVMDEHCDIEAAVANVLMSKSFDYGVICASEQCVIVMDSIFDKVEAEFRKRGAFVMDAEQKEKVGHVLFPTREGKRYLNPAVVGISPNRIAELAGVECPPRARILMAKIEEVSMEEVWSREKLSPALALIRASSWDNCCELAEGMLKQHGLGHSAAFHTNEHTQQDRIDEFTYRCHVGRVIINSPSAHGGLGDIYNFVMNPSLTLGCGSVGGSSTMENVAPGHLINLKTVAIKRENCLWMRAPPKTYFKFGCLSEAMKDLKQFKKAFIVTDKVLFDLGFVDRVTNELTSYGIPYSVFTDVLPDPNLECCMQCVDRIKACQPDLILALGGGSAMDLMKMARLMYEAPETDFSGCAQRFMDIRKRAYMFPDLLSNPKTFSVCIPTTSGTGSEVTPFAVITDSVAGIKYPLADYNLMPQMAIVDSSLVMSMPKFLAAWTGLDALTHAIEAHVSVLAHEYSTPYALQAIKLVFSYLEESVNTGSRVAREKMHSCATLAGMAFANSFLGICHSMAHKLGQKWHIPHGLANAIMLIPTIQYNATDAPFKQGLFPMYTKACAKARYAEIADYCGISAAGQTDDEKVQALCDRIDGLIAAVGVKRYIKDTRNPPSQEEYEASLDYVAEQAFDDQCTGANPRYPLISELRELLSGAYAPQE
ncbi:bifunctional aldehyde-alcohol dehydrogenase [Kipferlia bialata]|uniref:Aldehyde-alcohol dehydrogenase n=1 Tax=Kipferlia bialata TaxID=797122 RepID=A0A9K3CU62_9EUKA|nr:bifunctional aldehyde-alcohol dehydrogenase [Kipferlia bialata]|eukprot:g4527.t1